MSLNLRKTLVAVPVGQEDQHSVQNMAASLVLRTQAKSCLGHPRLQGDKMDGILVKLTPMRQIAGWLDSGFHQNDANETRDDFFDTL
jgi:hypothetical protein